MIDPNRSARSGSKRNWKEADREFPRLQPRRLDRRSGLTIAALIDADGSLLRLIQS